MDLRRIRASWAVSAALASFLMAGSAVATVTIDHVLVGAGAPLQIGERFEVQVLASWDGQGKLIHIFSSTGIVAGDPTGLVAESAVLISPLLYRRSLFAFIDVETGDGTYLNRLAPGSLRAPNDPLSLVRSVQYGSTYQTTNTSLDPRGAASDVLVTTISYRVVLPGSYVIGSVLAPGDVGPDGDVAGIGSTVSISAVPEPGSPVLIALGLAGLALSRPRKSVDSAAGCGR